MNTPRKGSRTYRILMDWKTVQEPTVIVSESSYKAAKDFLDDIQRVWTKKGKGVNTVERVSHNRLTFGKLTVWFEEEKNVQEQEEGKPLGSE